MDIKTIKIEKPEDANIIIGQSHFIKTAEDIYEALINSVPGIKFGVAFCESSGPCLVRSEGTDETLKKLAERNCLNAAAGHSFIIIMRDAYPINVLKAVKDVPEVCGIYCATANSVELVVAETGQGRGILGVVDGLRTKGVETDKDVTERKEFLRKIGYKL
ncbi:MAG: adenosine-specific kinase [Candidatus Omnitrophota bacterium]